MFRDTRNTTMTATMTATMTVETSVTTSTGVTMAKGSGTSTRAAVEATVIVTERLAPGRRRRVPARRSSVASVR